MDQHIAARVRRRWMVIARGDRHEREAQDHQVQSLKADEMDALSQIEMHCWEDDGGATVSERHMHASEAELERHAEAA